MVARAVVSLARPRSGELQMTSRKRDIGWPTSKEKCPQRGCFSRNLVGRWNLRSVLIHANYKPKLG